MQLGLRAAEENKKSLDLNKAHIFQQTITGLVVHTFANSFTVSRIAVDEAAFAFLSRGLKSWALFRAVYLFSTTFGRIVGANSRLRRVLCTISLRYCKNQKSQQKEKRWIASRSPHTSHWTNDYH